MGRRTAIESVVQRHVKLADVVGIDALNPSPIRVARQLGPSLVDKDKLALLHCRKGFSLCALAFSANVPRHRSPGFARCRLDSSAPACGSAAHSRSGPWFVAARAAPVPSVSVPPEAVLSLGPAATFHQASVSFFCNSLLPCTYLG